MKTKQIEMIKNNKWPLFAFFLILFSALFALFVRSQNNETLSYDYAVKMETTAWDYLNKIVEKRKVKQEKLNQIDEISMEIDAVNKEIETMKAEMDKLQYSWLDYMGF